MTRVVCQPIRIRAERVGKCPMCPPMTPAEGAISRYVRAKALAWTPDFTHTSRKREN